LQLDKWATLQVYATAFIQRLNLIKQSILPNYIFIPEAPAMTFDSFTGLQRMITVQLNFTLVVPTNCEPVVSKLVECIANILTSSNLTASLTSVIKLVSSLQASSSLSASALVSKLAASSLTGAGTLAADLTVTSVITDLLLDLYPNAAAAYSLRKLRTAYTGDAIRVRRSSDNTEQDIGFTALGVLDESALTTFCGAGNGFVTTWYDQSGSANDATQSTAANQPQIVSSGLVILTNTKPALKFNDLNDNFQITSNFNTFNTNSIFNICAPLNYTGVSVNARFYSLFDGVNRIQYLNEGVSSRLAFRNSRWNPVATQFITQNPPTTQFLSSILALSNSDDLYLNNIIQNKSTISGVGAAGSVSRIGIRADLNNSTQFIGNYQELVIYETDQSTNLNAINTNINTHYAIY
jgi:hypothetical protein